MKSICVTGFFSSGSSAVMDYLAEFDNTSFIKGREDYEHSLFYIGDGLFELYDRLYSDRSNYLSRSYALNQFVDLINTQYNNNFGWFGSYKKIIGESFEKAGDTFINSISSQDGIAVDLADYKGVYYSPIKGLLQIAAHFVYGYKISKLGRQYKKKNRPYRYLTVNEEEFISNCKLFLEEYARLCNIDSKELVVFDHLVTAEQVYGVDRFLPESYKVIIIDRSPVDIYLLSKYVWNTPKHHYHPPVPLNVDDFCINYCFQRRNIEKIKEMKNVLYMRFEDLVLDYDKSISTINDFCGLDISHHFQAKKYFDPEISINNIGLLAKYDNEEGIEKKIKDRIPESLYFYYENMNKERKSVF